jgi:hypothetical protein
MEHERTGSSSSQLRAPRAKALVPRRAVLWLAALVAVGFWGYPFLAGRLFP